jgi:hypothetical protein
MGFGGGVNESGLPGDHGKPHGSNVGFSAMNMGRTHALASINVGQRGCMTASLTFNECEPQVRHEVA